MMTVIHAWSIKKANTHTHTLAQDPPHASSLCARPPPPLPYPRHHRHHHPMSVVVCPHRPCHCYRRCGATPPGRDAGKLMGGGSGAAHRCGEGGGGGGDGGRSPSQAPSGFGGGRAPLPINGGDDARAHVGLHHPLPYMRWRPWEARRNGCWRRHRSRGRCHGRGRRAGCVPGGAGDGWCGGVCVCGGLCVVDGESVLARWSLRWRGCCCPPDLHNQNTLQCRRHWWCGLRQGGRWALSPCDD
mmetsp:Transcript_17764/g.42681  ORF Transcript_17764/g.42681 Transcript_17764/m.42681 type:complete len:243 (+) Transcript_17764:1304-2032(+)